MNRRHIKLTPERLLWLLMKPIKVKKPVIAEYHLSKEHKEFAKRIAKQIINEASNLF